ncbi:MAG TPA: amylo-alpha-1,6-glucosidase [Candidatus Eisenbacteria bacterium]|nr:amylo-alpha-1,6-glucosidase [Candidatus Eisenbacteria bacterium]
MNDVLRLTDEYYILATASTAEEARVLKHGESFGVFDRHGDIQQVGLGEQGIYYQGTRFLSRLVFTLGNLAPFLLSSTIKEDNVLLSVDLTNPDIYLDGVIALPRGDLHISRSKFLWNAVCYERLSFVNYGLQPVELTFSIQFDADFIDIFEVRGVKRNKRGVRLQAEIQTDAVTLAYKGLDGVRRQTRIDFHPAPEKLGGEEASYRKILAPKEQEVFSIRYAFSVGDSSLAQDVAPEEALHQTAQAIRKRKAEECRIFTSNDEFNGWLNRSSADLHMMFTETEYGLYPYAGVPWFNTAFGRDGIITALEFLWINPRVAKGVLGYLAATQATETIPEKDAEPGKILHEVRTGEMAALGEIPFARYYGSTDATPLFVMLAGAYHERTGDLEFIKSIWPQIKLALKWLDTYGDPDGDGFVESCRRSTRGLAQQGWKDSWDSLSHEDGSLPQGPVALCEVQGYAYAARREAARLAFSLAEFALARDLVDKAESLKKRFNEAFWSEKISTYAMALDEAKRPCRIRASNAGHCLFTGIASEEYAARVAQTLLSDESFSGWGIRTLATSEVRYNPMSYHNGSVWPHDNAIIAAGLARYGMKEAANKVLTALFDASLFLELRRMPELFCGFPRRDGEGPTLYPVACAPQAWAAGAVFLLLQSCLGLSIDATESKVSFTSPLLPAFMEKVQIKNLRVGSASLDLVVDRSFHGIGVERRRGDVNIVIR